MKKILSILVITIGFVSCNNTVKNEDKEVLLPTSYSMMDTTVCEVQLKIETLGTEIERKYKCKIVSGGKTKVVIIEKSILKDRLNTDILSTHQLNRIYLVECIEGGVQLYLRLCLPDSDSCYDLVYNSISGKVEILNFETVAAEINNLEDECVFDMSVQNGDFLKEKVALNGFVWDDDQKVALGKIGEDSLQIERGGCGHFTYSCKFKTADLDTLDFTNPSFGITKILAYSELAFEERDFKIVKSILGSEGLELEVHERRKHAFFEMEDYCSASMYISRFENGIFEVEIGFYLC